MADTEPKEDQTWLILALIGLLVVTAKYGWLVGAGVYGGYLLLVALVDPWIDCAGCKGVPKRRGFGFSRRTFHLCARPWWLGGCRGRGRRRRVLSVLLGRGLGRLD